MCGSDYMPNFYDNPNYNIPDDCILDIIKEKENQQDEHLGSYQDPNWVSVLDDSSSIQT